MLGAERGALDGVVLVELEAYLAGGVGRFPTPFADGDELERHTLLPAQTGALAADVKAVADADVGGDDEAGGAIGGEDAFREFGGLRGGGVVDLQAEAGLRVGLRWGAPGA